MRLREHVRSGLALRLVLCACVLGLLLWVANDGPISSAIQGAFARIVGGILNVFGEGALVTGNTVQTQLFGISVVTACTGLFLTGLFAAAVILFPARWRAKWIGLGLGIGGIFLLNVVRLVTLYYIGVHWPAVLDTVHRLVWQSLLIAFAVVLWLIWAGVWGRAPRREVAT